MTPAILAILSLIPTLQVGDEKAFRRLFPQFVAGLEKVGRGEMKVQRRNPEEACRPLFPNLWWAHNDGKTIRWETRASLGLPFEAVGIETVIALYSLARGL